MVSYIALQKNAGKYISHIETTFAGLDKYLIDSGKSEKSLNEADITGWISTLQVAHATKKKYFSVLKGFSVYLQSLELHCTIPSFSRNRGTAYTPYIFSDDEFLRIIDASDNLIYSLKRLGSDTSIGFPVLVRLLYTCGLRLNEALNLRVSDIDFEEGALIINKAKRNRQRFVPMKPSMTEMLSAYSARIGIIQITEAFLFSLSALSSFASFAINKCPSSALRFYTEVSAVPQKKKPERTPVYFTRREVTVLLKLPDGATKASARDRVLLSVLYASGARAQELCDITVGDIRFDGKTSIKLVGKGNKGRIVTIPEKCVELLLFHLKTNGLISKPDKYVFSSQTHEHMSISCIEGIVKKYVRLAKKQNPDMFPEKHYTPHSFRHSIAVHMLESGIPLPVIKNFLGHTSIETTMIYATVSADLANQYLKNKSIINDMIPTEQNIAATEKPGLEFLKISKR